MIRLVRKPVFYVALLITAAVANAAGYLLTLWHEQTIFDEAMHLYTSFAVVSAVGYLARKLLRRRPPPWTLLVVGVVLGVAWEGFEWLIGIIGIPRDTAVDVLMDASGAALAVLLNWFAFRAAEELITKE